MTRSKTLVAIAVVVVTAALTAQAGAVPSPVAQQETPDGEPAEETPDEEPATPDGEPAEETPDDEPTNETPADEPATPDDGANETPSLTFEDQETDGETVTVSNVTLTEPGYVVINDESYTSGQATGSVIGTSDYLPAGEYDNVTITLFDVPGADDGETDNATNETPDETDAETPLEAVNETPDETDAETPLEAVNETPDETATETPDETATETPDETATETPTDTETTNATNATQEQLTGTQELTAVIHAETSDDRTFDYVDTIGLVDGPVQINDVPVSDTATVTAVDNETATDDGTATDNETATDDGTATDNETPTDGETAVEPGTATPAP